jgi:hypothetical protein
MLVRKEGIIVCNPGDQHRGSNEAPTFALLEVSVDSLDCRIMKKEDVKIWKPALNLRVNR